MQHKQGKLLKDIQRSIQRLAALSKEGNATTTIPAFFYSASLLNTYAKLKGSDQAEQGFFQRFKLLTVEFGKQDFTTLSRNNRQILDQILEIVDSQLFILCLRPDIKTHRHLPYEPHEPQEIIRARDRYNFQLGPQHIKSAYLASQLDSPAKSIKSFQSSQFLVNQYDELWQTIERSYREHNIDDAYKLSLEYVEKISKKTEIPKDRQQLIEQIAGQYTNMMEFYSQFDKGEWQFDKQQKGISLEYKVYEQEKMIAIRITGQFDIPLEPFLSVICEINLMGDYVPFCYDSKELKVVSRNERIGTSKIYIPLLTDRQTYFYAVGYDRQKVTGGIFLYSKTINEDFAFQNKYGFQVPKESQYVRLEYKFFIVEYLPLTKQRAKIRLSSKIDMKMNYLPLFILNKSARIFAFDYFKNILKISKNYKGSPWEKSASERPDLYDFFKKKMSDYFGEQ